MGVDQASTPKAHLQDDGTNVHLRGSVMENLLVIVRTIC